MHKFQRNTLSLMLIILPVVCNLLPSRYFRKLPKTVLPADQLAPQPQDINGYPGPPCPKPPATPVHCVNATHKISPPSLQYSELPKIHGQLLQNNAPLQLLSPLIPPSPTSLHLLPYPQIYYLILLFNVLSHLFNASYPLFNVCYPTHIRKF